MQCQKFNQSVIDWKVLTSYSSFCCSLAGHGKNPGGEKLKYGLMENSFGGGEERGRGGNEKKKKAMKVSQRGMAEPWLSYFPGNNACLYLEIPGNVGTPGNIKVRSVKCLEVDQINGSLLATLRE